MYTFKKDILTNKFLNKMANSDYFRIRNVKLISKLFKNKNIEHGTKFSHKQ